MSRSMIAPGKYVQGNGELGNIGVHLEKIGKSFFFIASKSGIGRTRDRIEKSFKGGVCRLVFEVFGGESTREEIERLRDIFKRNGCDTVVGIGGGKIIDTAKAISYYEDVPVAIVPTIASTDAPCSAISIIYTTEGVFSEILMLKRNPDLVLVDSGVIACAPARLLVSGMGDALATYFEARACLRSGADSMAGSKPTLAAISLAKLCYDILLEDGLKAVAAVKNKSVTQAVENIIEANTYLSGLGFESGGLAAAHSVHNGLTVLKECREMYHGEKVAFGTLVQLVLENASKQEIETVVKFCLEVGLPVKLEDLGIKEFDDEDILNVARAACAEGETIHNMPFAITPQDVRAAILTADSLGRMYSK